MQRGGDVLVKFASLNITMNASKVTVKSGKFRRSMHVAEWSALVSQSMATMVSLNPKATRPSSQIYLVRGLGFRLKAWEGMSDCLLLIQQPRPLPAPITPPLQTTHPMAPNLGNVRFDQVLHSVEQNVLRNEGDEVSIIAKAGEEAFLTAMRFVQRNILHQEISRHISQDVKIAVALRDRGRCTHIDHFGERCTATTRLQYDHRFIPFSLGGPQRIWNLTLYCKTHNQAKSDQVDFAKALVEFFGGLLP
jgi:hypothetical protein